MARPAIKATVAWMSFMHAIATVLNEGTHILLVDPATKKDLETLITNATLDSLQRCNEGINILERISKDKNFSKSFAKMERDFAEFRKLYDEAEKAREARKK